MKGRLLSKITAAPGNVGRALSLWLLAVQGAAGQSLPVVTHGDAKVETKGSEMVVQLNKSSRLEWRDFLVGEKGALRFRSAPGEPRASLNVVKGSVPARIFGEVTADGPFYLISPAGIQVGGNGRIIAPQVLLSALPAADDLALLEGRSTTFQNLPGGNSSVSVAGQVVASSGSLTVIGPSVQVTGRLEAKNGIVRVIGADQQPVKGPDAKGQFEASTGQSFKSVVNTGQLTGARVEIVSDGFIQNGGQIAALRSPVVNDAVVRLSSRGTRHEQRPGSVIWASRVEVNGPFEQQGPIIYPQDGANPSAIGGIRQTPRLSQPGFFTHTEAGMTQLSHSPLQNGAVKQVSPLPTARHPAAIAARSGSTDEKAVATRLSKKQPAKAAGSLRKASFFGQTVRR